MTLCTDLTDAIANMTDGGFYCWPRTDIFGKEKDSSSINSQICFPISFVSYHDAPLFILIYDVIRLTFVRVPDDDFS